MRGCSGQEGEKKTERRTFLSLEEAGLVEISGLDTHERFLCRLTVPISLPLQLSDFSMRLEKSVLFIYFINADSIINFHKIV